MAHKQQQRNGVFLRGPCWWLHTKQRQQQRNSILYSVRSLMLWAGRFVETDPSSLERECYITTTASGREPQGAWRQYQLKNCKPPVVKYMWLYKFSQWNGVRTLVIESVESCSNEEWAFCSWRRCQLGNREKGELLPLEAATKTNWEDFLCAVFPVICWVYNSVIVK